MLKRSSISDAKDDTDERLDTRLLAVEWRTRGVVPPFEDGLSAARCSLGIRIRLSAARCSLGVRVRLGVLTLLRYEEAGARGGPIMPIDDGSGWRCAAAAMAF